MWNFDVNLFKTKLILYTFVFKIERSKTKGKGWFNMSAPELTEERENDLKILQMRSVLDPKHFYKKNDLKVLPKYYQVKTLDQF